MGKMVIATKLCALSEYRIYPGNGKLLFLGSSKAYSLTLQRKKPAKLVWTQAWRRLHKKGLAETTQKKRTRRVAKVARAVVGASLEDIKKKATRTSAQREAALKEVKARKSVAKDKKRADKARGSGAGQRTKLPKNVKR